MVDIVLRTVLQEETLINATIEFLEHDLHIITKEGVTIRTSKFLVGRGSPILRSLLSSGVNAISTPSFLFLPDVTAPAILHFISVIKKGTTNGRGWGYPVIKQVREVAELLAFENIPLLTFVEPQEVEELAQSVPQVLNESVMDILNSEEAEEVPTDSGNVEISFQMETVDNQDEQDKHTQNDDDHIALSIDKLVTHQAEYCPSSQIPAEHSQDEHMLAEYSQSSHMQAEYCQSSHTQAEHSQDEHMQAEHFGPKSPIQSNNMNGGEIEIHAFKSQEITEAITKVLKKDPDDTIATEDVSKFPCGKCRKPFSCAGTLLVHAEKHGELKGKRKCTLCNFSGLRSNLLAHIRSKHTKEKLFECTVCLKKFSTSQAKNTHESIHIQPKEKLFDCSVCHQKFSSCRAKNEHEKKHTSQA